jgi:hypothetical protein
VRVYVCTSWLGRVREEREEHRGTQCYAHTHIRIWFRCIALRLCVFREYFVLFTS